MAENYITVTLAPEEWRRLVASYKGYAARLAITACIGWAGFLLAAFVLAWGTRPPAFWIGVLVGAAGGACLGLVLMAALAAGARSERAS